MLLSSLWLFGKCQQECVEMWRWQNKIPASSSAREYPGMTGDIEVKKTRDTLECHDEKLQFTAEPFPK
ncbi:hypothetical protein BTVI_159028 [Pitangus sulphuratus]|nr:hypothetical protein BTVI_159028 [Pitangus sulphuratus]